MSTLLLHPTAPAAAGAFAAAVLQTAVGVVPFTDWWRSRQPMQVVDTVDQSFVEAGSRRYRRMGRRRARSPLGS